MRGEIAACQQCSGDDTHGFLRVVSAMPQAVSGGGEKLEFAKELIHGARRGVLEDPGNGDHQARGPRSNQLAAPGQ